MKEQHIWKGSPSHWTMFGWYLLWLLPLAWAGFGLVAACWLWLTTKTWRITVTSHRITQEKGVLTKNSHELELYRFKDIALNEPFLLRLVGLSQIVMLTSDRTTPVFVIPGLRNGKHLKEKLRDIIDVVERDYE